MKGKPQHFLAIWMTLLCCLWVCPLRSAAQAKPVPEKEKEEEKADDKHMSDAQKHFRAGLGLLRAENYSGAATEFELAVWLYPTKSALFNLANCYKALHKYDKSVRTFKRLVEEFETEMSDELKESVERHKTEIIELSAELLIEVKPKGAKIKIDGDDMGNSPLAAPLLLSPGTREVEVSFPGHETKSRIVTIASTDKQVVSFTLKPTRAELKISANSDGAQVFVDKRLKGKTPLTETIVLEAGDHTVRLVKQGFGSAERIITLAGGEQAEAEFVLIPLRTQPATVEIQREPNSLNRLSVYSWLGLGLTIAGGITTGIFGYKASQHYDEYVAKGGEMRALEKNDEYLKANSTGKTEMETAISTAQDSIGDEVLQDQKITWGIGIPTAAIAIATAIFITVELSRDEEEPHDNAHKKQPKTYALHPSPGGLAVSF